MNFETWFQTQHPTIPVRSAQAVLELTAEGATLPFIARYRKEKTGNLSEVGVRDVIDSKEIWDQVQHRQKFILEEIERQGKLTDELKARISGTFELERLEDLYLPYKQKRRTKAALAREAGLEALSDWIYQVGAGEITPEPGQTLEIWAFTFKNEEKGFADAAAAIQGATDILVELFSEVPELRERVRTQYRERGGVRTIKGEKSKPNSKYESYFDFSEPVANLLLAHNSHRYLAMRRGWIEEEIKMSLGAPQGDETFESELESMYAAHALKVQDSMVAELLLKAARLALKAHVVPSIENEIHRQLREVADGVAIQVFAENVRKLLLAAPFGSKAVLGLDPGIRTGCKLAVVDDSGKYLASTVIQLQTDAEKLVAKELLSQLVGTAKIQAIAVGNGTGGRETEIFARATMKEKNISVPVVLVNEAGASVYSASDVAREEFPDLDLTIRGAISIARRLQDPLSELVKIDPKSIGVGQYQHDLAAAALKRSLEFVVDSCVNSVGVDLNTASKYLLSRVAGVGSMLAENIVEYRQAKGLFKNRQELKEVSRFSDKTFEQAAGFLRIRDGANPLDNTGVHPEKYPAIEDYAKKHGKNLKDLIGGGASQLKKDPEFKAAVGEFTAADVIAELEKPGRDPRDVFVPFSFREDIHELKDLKADMICPGVVTNVTNFGAFVDIGVHQDGLVHISQISERFIKDPKDAVSPGQRVTVKVLEVNLEKKQISLTIKGAGEKSAPAPREAREERAPRAPRQEPRAPRPTPSGAPGLQPRGSGAQARPQGPRPTPTAVGGSAGKFSAPKPKEAFNNPFAALAGIKKELKK
jgi:uncharacterized protein